MILTCPSCSARYLLATDAIGENGRSVRCGKCGHVWQEPPARDSLDELNAADFTIPSEEAPPPDPAPEEEPVKEFPAYKTAEDLSEKPAPPALPFAHSRLAGAITAIAVFGILATVAVMARASIISAFPSSQPVYEALGLDERETAAPPLIFDDVTAEISGKDLSVHGKLINLSSQPVALSPMTVEILDSDGAVIKTYPADIQQKEIEGEASIDLDFSYKDAPEAGRQVRLILDPTTGAKDAGNIPAHPAGD